ncbi:hypothetical protein ALPO108162_05200 [Alicyclobacillus pomorum]
MGDAAPSVLFIKRLIPLEQTINHAAYGLPLWIVLALGTDERIHPSGILT